MNTIILKLIKEIQFISPLRRYFFPRYIYNMTPPQLCFLCACLEKVKNVPGAIVEVGCAAGSTTIFLNKYMTTLGIEKDYFAIDTFSGFTANDVKYEVLNRGKQKRYYTDSGFQFNKKKWFDWTMKSNDIQRVRSIQADINAFDFSTLGKICFCLLDVDLFLPTKNSLNPLFESISYGGLLIIDDCDPSNFRWDGSYQAYKEFCQDNSFDEEIVLEKLGIVRK